jgi:hypothetical protein
VKSVNLVDQQGKDVAVPQEQLVPLLRAGFKVRPGQTVTMGDESGTEIPVERVIEGLNLGYAPPRLQTEREAFEMEAQKRFGGGAGLAAGLGYGALQGATLGLGGKALMETGLVAPETLAQLEEARGGGMFSTIGAGELVGGALAFKGAGKLLGPAVGSAAEAAMLEREAAKGVGRRIAETAAKEAGIGAAYATGSEVTQAGIEGREANLLEAAKAGAEVGGTLGLAGATLAEGAGKAKAMMRSAAEKRAAKDIVDAATVTTETLDKDVATSRLDAERENIRAYAKNTHDTLAGIVERLNNAAKGADDLGYGLSGKGIKKATAKVEALQKAITGIDERITSNYDQAIVDLEKTLADTIKTGFENKTKRAAALGTIEQELVAARQDLADATASKSSKSTINGIENRIKKLQSTQASIAEQEATFTELGTATTKLGTIAENLGQQYRIKARETARANSIRRKLADTTEQAAELAGGSAQAARDEAREFMRESSVLKDNAGAATAEAVKAGVSADVRSVYADEFAQPSIEAARGALDGFRSIVGDMFTVERGLYREGERLVEGGPKKGATKLSVFTQIFDSPTVRQSLTPENAAYVRSLTSSAKENDLIRGAHHKSKRAANITRAIDEQFSAEGGLENILGKERYAEIVGAAKSDAQAFLANEPTSSDAQNVLNRYRQMRAPVQGAEEAVAAAEAAAPAAPTATLADSTNIVAVDPSQTESLRKTLARHEANLAAAEEQIAALSEQRANAFKERKVLTDKLASAKSDTRKKVLSENIESLKNRQKLIDDSQRLVDGMRAIEQDRVAALKQARSTNSIDAAQDAANASAERQKLDTARRAADRRVLDERRTALGTKLEGAKNAKIELERLVADHRAAQKDLEAFIGRGEKFVRSSGSGRLVPLAEEQIFQARFNEFMRSPEGREITASLKKAAPGSTGQMGPKDVAGILGMELLASSILGPAMGTVATGIATAVLSGKKGVIQGMKTLMNPVRFWSVAGDTMQAMSQLTTQSGRRGEMRKTYQFPVAEANKYLDSIVADRESANNAFDKLLQSGAVKAANVQEARRRFDSALDYLERKRPPTMNGSDAQAFARSVALLQNPNLLTQFVRDGSLRQQDVDLLRKVSPESYEQLRGAVLALHQQKPAAASALAPLFKIMVKDKYMMRTTLPMAVLQAMGGAAPPGAPGQGVPMQSKSDAAAARGRATSAKDSPTASTMGFADQGPIGGGG